MIAATTRQRTELSSPPSKTPTGATPIPSPERLISAAKGAAWESPRGPVSIDPETRDIVQTVYIRRVERIDGELRNIEFDRVENVKDPLKGQKK
jgi:hypothetical protein